MNTVYCTDFAFRDFSVAACQPAVTVLAMTEHRQMSFPPFRPDITVMVEWA